MTNKRIGLKQTVRVQNEERTQTSSGDEPRTPAEAEQQLRDAHGGGAKHPETKDDHVRRDAIRQRVAETCDYTESDVEPGDASSSPDDAPRDDQQARD